MTRLWLILTFFIMALLMLALVALRAGPADDEGLKSLLFPSTCSTPCFIGIQPGVTAIGDARALLENHPWVMEVELVFAGPDAIIENRDGRLHWRWNGRQPVPLKTPFLEAGEIVAEHGVVQSVKVTTAVPFGDVWLVLGRPTHGFIGTSRVYLERLDNHMAVYNERGLKMQTLLPHNSRITTFWNAFVEIIFEAAPRERQTYRLPCWLGCE
jgi:hypothetical protein